MRQTASSCGASRRLIPALFCLAVIAALAASAPAVASSYLEGLGPRDRPGFGNAVFGEWTTDDFGMPAYIYAMRHDDPRSKWDPKTRPINNLMWHHLGNERVNANAYNLGFVQLFYGESGAMWLNEYDPSAGAHAGGFGWLIAGDTVLVDRDDYVSEGARWERVFGTGYFLKRLEAGGLKVERAVFAPVRPSGMYPFLVSEVTIANDTGREIEADLIEYWDVNTRLLTDVLMGKAMLKQKRDGRVEMASGDGGIAMLRAETKEVIPGRGFPDKPVLVDPQLPALFLASLDAKPDAWITDPAELFDGATLIVDPEALLSAGGAEPRPGRRAQKDACLAGRFRVTVPAGGARVLRFAYGYERDWDTAELLASLREGVFEDSRLVVEPGERSYLASSALTWRAELPGLDLPGDRFMDRELKWDYYYFLGSSLYDAYYGRRKIPQGANYLYYSGMDGATRDFSAYVQALCYYRPLRARELLEFMMRCQETDGRLFYDIGGFGARYNNPYRPGDLDIWFLWSLSEYVFATRDFEFLDAEVPFHPLHKGEIGTVWEHARRSLDHLIDTVGTGPHGNPKLRLSDWNDEMMWLTAGSNPVDMALTFKRGESVMNTAMNAVMLPMLVGLAERRGDDYVAERARDYNELMLVALGDAWNGEHLVRSYSGLGRVFGDEEMYLEPQAWALLKPGILAPGRERALVEKIGRELRAPSDLGMMISTSTSGSPTTRPGEQEEGGIWFAINGPAAVALARFDQELAWDEIVRNTLAWHAHVYPETWYGVWSGPDAWNSVFSDRPSETWYMKTPIINTGPQMYPVQNAHAHCQTMWAVARLAGIEPAAVGWTVDPRLPFRNYSFDCALYSLEVSSESISGRVRAPGRDTFELRVRRPGLWRREDVFVLVDGERATPTHEEDYIIVDIDSGPDLETSWEIRSETGLPGME